MGRRAVYRAVNRGASRLRGFTETTVDISGDPCIAAFSDLRLVHFRQKKLRFSRIPILRYISPCSELSSPTCARLDVLVLPIAFVSTTSCTPFRQLRSQARRERMQWALRSYVLNPVADVCRKRSRAFNRSRRP